MVMSVNPACELARPDKKLTALKATRGLRFLLEQSINLMLDA